MRWAITGSKGMLGTDLCTVLGEQGQDVTPLSSSECDIRDLRAVQLAVEGHQVVVNAAGWTAVDDAEMSEQAVEAVFIEGHLHDEVTLTFLAPKNQPALPASITSYLTGGGAALYKLLAANYKSIAAMISGQS